LSIIFTYLIALAIIAFLMVGIGVIVNQMVAK